MVLESENRPSSVDHQVVFFYHESHTKLGFDISILLKCKEKLILAFYWNAKIAYLETFIQDTQKKIQCSAKPEADRKFI